MGKKKILFIIFGLVAIVSLIGGTYAWFTYVETNRIELGSSGYIDFSYSTGTDTISGNLYPTLNYQNGIMAGINLKTKENTTLALRANFYLEIVTLPSELSAEYFKWAIYKNGDPFVLGSGNFSGVSPGDKITVLSNSAVSNVYDVYNIYLWLDGNYDIPSETQGMQIEMKYYAEAHQSNDERLIAFEDPSGANHPEIIDGMIPIVYNNVWVKADILNGDGSWYNYEQKKWANAVLVKSVSTTNTTLSDGTVCTGTNSYCTREDYMNARTSIKIPEDDILAYYVWIPRYSVSGHSTNIYEIPVRFDEGINKSYMGYQSPYQTHSAFSFNNQELEGIWVGKFEMTGTTGAPTVKPNVAPLTNATLYARYNAHKSIASSTYLTERGVSEIDAHLMMNREWGAVTILKQSKYGLGVTDVALNNYYSSGYKTGCGSDVGVTTTTTICNPYNSTLGMNASTTGNIYGVYDMAGGAPEAVMAVMNNSDGTGLVYSSSGFTNTSTAATYLPVDSLYIDTTLYRATIDTTFNAVYECNWGCPFPNNAMMYGSADWYGNSEYGWYGDAGILPYGTSLTWVSRGGSYNGGEAAGIFAYSPVNGGTGSASRSVLFNMSE